MVELFQFRFTNELFSEEEIECALKLKLTIENKIRELEKEQEDYFFENTERHKNDKEIAKFKKLLGEPFTPSTYEEDEAEFVGKMNQRTKGGESKE